MTAPALPGAAPDPAPGRNDPAQLPPKVPVIGVVSSPNSAWRGGMKHTVVMDGTSLASSCDRESAQFAVEIARLAIARALGGDGEPVAWACDKHSPSNCAGSRWVMVCEWTRGGAGKVPDRCCDAAVPLYTRPAATGDHPSEARRGQGAAGDQGGPDAR